MMNKMLLLRYIEGAVTDQEKVTIVTWLDADPEHMREYLSLRKLHDITLWQQPASASLSTRVKDRAPAWSLRSVSINVAKVAAIFMLALFVYKFLLPGYSAPQAVEMQTLYVPAGQRALITLVDGTKVWLNANTTFSFPNQFLGQKREVQLQGEGYFDVIKDKTIPFLVKTENYDIKVWGTEFNVMAYPGNNLFETSLLEGSVEVMKSGGAQGAFIQPNERLFWDGKSLKKAPIIHYNHFLWKEGIISFDNERFPDLVKKLELYFDLKIDVRNELLLKYRCTGKFRTKDGVEHILKVLQLSNDFKFKMDDKQNLIVIE
jgi:ferric-dicitrate binding protein FerR (iron transport regulator)